jgi:hypothetical protein
MTLILRTMKKHMGWEVQRMIHAASAIGPPRGCDAQVSNDLVTRPSEQETMGSRNGYIAGMPAIWIWLT